MHDLQKEGLARRRIFYYVQPADHKTNNFLRTALPEKVIKRSGHEVFGTPVPSEFDLYRTSWNDIEIFMGYSYLTFNVYKRRETETLPRFAMRKSPDIEARNNAAERVNIEKLSLVKCAKPLPQKKVDSVPKVQKIWEIPKKCFPERPELSQENSERMKKSARPEKRTLILLDLPKTKKTKNSEVSKKEKTENVFDVNVHLEKYLICPQHKHSTVESTISHIRKALLESGLSTQSTYESGKSKNESFDLVWEANGNALFTLWRYARQNEYVRFVVTRSPKDGMFDNLEEVLIYPKENKRDTKFSLLQYNSRNS